MQLGMLYLPYKRTHLFKRCNVADGLLHPSYAAYTSRPGGLDGSMSLNSIGAWPKMPMTAGSLPLFFVAITADIR